MAIKVEKRTRALVTDDWGVWAVTTEAPDPVDGYLDTDLVEYRVDEGIENVDIPAEVTIDISDVTTNAKIEDDDGDYKVTGDGYFDDLMETVNLHMKAQYDSRRLKGPQYAQVYLGMMQATLGQAMAFAVTKRQKEVDASIAQLDLEVATSTAQDRVDTSAYKSGIEKVNLGIAVDTQDDKIALVTKQLEKMGADISYVESQETALKEQVKDNRLIKTLDTLGETYGTFGAGGLTVSEEMWDTYFYIVTYLAGGLNRHVGTWDIFNQTEASVIDDADITSDASVYAQGDYFTTKNTYLGEWDSASAPDVVPEDGDYYVMASDRTIETVEYLQGDSLVYRDATGWGKETTAYIEGTNNWEGGDALILVGSRWTRSLASVPSNTTVTKVEST